MESIIIYTDGACRGNGKEGNVGAWAYRMQFGNYVKEDSEAFRDTTNNIMELAAICEAMAALKPSAVNYNITVYSDSMYAINGLNEWAENWERNNWHKSTGGAVKNRMLWEALLQFKRDYPNAVFKHVSGHSTSEGNNRVDELCNLAMDRLIQENK